MGIGLGVAVLVAALVAIATWPNALRVQRTIHIEASPEAVFSYLVDFRRWAAGEKLDANMKKTYGGRVRV